MPEDTTIIRFADSLQEDNISRFIDPFSDFGFKHLFGKVPNRNFLIGFLNEVRSFFYTANLIQAQGEGVIADWSYLLPEIYFIAVMNFKFDDSHPGHFLHDVRMMEMNTNIEFYPKLSYIFIEMPKFRKAEEELDNELEEWLYILNNLERLSEIPLSLKGKGEYDEIFEIAEVGNLTPDEMNEYQQSLKIQRDNNSAMRMAKAEGLEEGLEKGHEKGVNHGRNEEKQEIAVKLKIKGMPVDEIKELTGLSAEEIQAL